MSYDLMDDVANKTLAGISKAQKDYEDWTGGYWLWEAPESMVTTYIARQISAISDKSFYLTLENKVRDGIRDAGGASGRPRKALRFNGKFDILLWWANGTPRAIIEVKNQVTGFSKIKDDVSRISAALKRQNTIRCGFIAYYTSLADGEYKLAKNRVEERVCNVASAVKEFAKDNNMKFKRYPGKVVKDEDSAWTAEVLKISR